MTIGKIWIFRQTNDDGYSYWTVATAPGWMMLTGSPAGDTVWMHYQTGAQAIAAVDAALREGRIVPLRHHRVRVA